MSLTENIECPKSLVGRVIGARGATITDLQARSGCRIQIDQQVLGHVRACVRASRCHIQIDKQDLRNQSHGIQRIGSHRITTNRIASHHR